MAKRTPLKGCSTISVILMDFESQLDAVEIMLVCVRDVPVGVVEGRAIEFVIAKATINKR